MGADIRFGDFTEPESLDEAYAEGDRTLLISIDTGLGGERPNLHRNAIDPDGRRGSRDRTLEGC